jgi:hypothetical protein
MATYHAIRLYIYFSDVGENRIEFLEGWIEVALAKTTYRWCDYNLLSGRREIVCVWRPFKSATPPKNLVSASISPALPTQKVDSPSFNLFYLLCQLMTRRMRCQLEILGIPTWNTNSSQIN